MSHFLLVGQTDGNLKHYAEFLKAEYKITSTQVELGQDALNLISNHPFDLVIVDEELQDSNGFKLVEEIVMTNPMVFCSMISSMEEEEFHESTEGLGVLAKLSVQPVQKELGELIQQLNKLLNLTSDTLDASV